jgi:hypothetical protein
MQDRLILLLVERENKEPIVHIYNRDFDKVLDSFKNCSAMTVGGRGRMTLVDISYSDGVTADVRTKTLPILPERPKEDGYKIGHRDGDENKFHAE